MKLKDTYGSKTTVDSIQTHLKVVSWVMARIA